MVFISDTDILGGIDSPKKEKKRENNSGGKTKIDVIILEVNIRKKVSCVFKIFLIMYLHSLWYHSRPVPDYRISTFVFLVPKVHFSQSQAFNFQNFLRKGQKILGHEAARILGAKFIRLITYTIPPSLK